jgi:hypothetical protein
MIRKHVDADQDSIRTWTATKDNMSGAQASYLQSLCKEAGVVFDPGTKTQTSKRIEELHKRTGRNWEH